MLILVINCGSSSAKYQLFNIEKKRVIKKGVIERIGEKNSACRSHYHAIELIKNKLTRGKKAAIKSLKEIEGIGHRVVHGGEEFEKSTLITGKVMRSIEKFSELAPLHNPPALEGIAACRKFFPGTPEVAVFDTAFHQTMPEEAYLYGLPFYFYKKYGIRRYGFHGTSHRFISEEAARVLKRPLKKLKLVTAHLGNGCSMAAVLRGKSIDTTMGFTPLEGLLMGTRSGDLDPAIVTYLMRKERLTSAAMDDMLNKKCGLLGVSGLSNDMRDIRFYIRKGNKRARLAYDIFLYRIKKYIGAYASAMGGLDAVVFAGGIGENMPEVKNTLQKELRPVLGKRVKFLKIHTNEELLIAKDTHKIIKSL
ncbi:MAG: acetate kinase [Candidatus Omnitrophica bacterium]|nr:acetate kinase [Candidatus Omnitrophota bacterium]